jgi:hypothetical protein
MLCTVMSLQAGPLTSEQSQFITDANGLGLMPFREDFSNDGSWGGTRAILGLAAVSVVSQGVEWTCNHPGCVVQTFMGSVRANEWAIIGDQDPLAVNPLDKTNSGFMGTRVPGGTGFRGVGAYVAGNGGNLRVFLDGVQNTEVVLDNLPQWVVVWSATPFNSFEFREMDGDVQQLRTLFADGVMLALENGGAVIVPEAANSLLLVAGLAMLGGLSRLRRRG